MCPRAQARRRARQRLRLLFWCVLLAVFISLLGSVAMILHLVYEYGGINLNGWFFGGGTRAPFDYITTKLNAPTVPNISGWVHTFIGGGIMALLVLARHTLLWWPFAPHRLSDWRSVAYGSIVV